MTQAFQLALGNNIPLTINAQPARVVLVTAAFLQIGGGQPGEVLTTDGNGNLSFAPPGAGGGGLVAVDGISIRGNGTPASPLSVGTVDGDTFTRRREGSNYGPPLDE